MLRVQLSAGKTPLMLAAGTPLLGPLNRSQLTQKTWLEQPHTLVADTALAHMWPEQQRTLVAETSLAEGLAHTPAPGSVRPRAYMWPEQQHTSAGIQEQELASKLV